MSILYAMIWVIFSRSPNVPAATPLTVEGALLIVLGAIAAFGLRIPILLAALLLAFDAVLVMALTGDFQPAGLIVRALIVVYLVQSWRRMGES